MTDFYNLVPTAPEGRYDGIERPYSPEDVQKLRGSVNIKYSLAEMGANRLWKLIHEEDFVNALGAMTGNQAMQQVRAGLKAIYLSGWQVAADSNTASSMYPDQSLYPANAAPELAKRINRTLQRADQIETAEGNGLSVDTWFAPIVADAEAGFGGPLNAFEIMKAFIEAGAAGVHYEDQLASEKKCGHLGGKVLIPTAAHIRNLNAARLAADVMGTPTLVIARTDAEAAKLLTSDIDERDRPFVDYDAGRTVEGFYNIKNGLDACIARANAYAPHCDLIWCETSKPDLEQARKFAEGVHKSIRASCLPTTARRRSTGRRTWTMQPSPSSSANSAPWATSSSSSRWPVSTSSTTACSNWPAATRTARCPPIRSCRKRNSLPRSTATPRPSTSAKSAPVTSTPSRWRSPAASPRPPQWANPRNRPSSSRPPSNTDTLTRPDLTGG
jgi:2-methylisocitrate lyase-like PEP mutase family enzyme